MCAGMILYVSINEFSLSISIQVCLCARCFVNIECRTRNRHVHAILRMVKNADLLWGLNIVDIDVQHNDSQNRILWSS